MSRLEESLRFLSGLPPDTGLVVGLSGGMDSVVLLHVMKHAPLAQKTLRAVHVNHGLQAAAGDWENFCRDYCAQLDVPLEIVQVDVSASAPSLENRARIARYQAFAASLQPGETLLLAHHLDDQMETVLQRMLRGAGVRGLSGIPARRKLGQGMLMRPLLSFPRADLTAYAREHDLCWVEDATNRNTDFDRNYCRHEILPVVEQRWPDYRRDWEKSRTLIFESQQLLNDLAEQDLARGGGESGNILRVDALQLLSESRRRNALRYWLERQCGEAADWKKLQDMSSWLLAANHSAETAVELKGWQVRRFGNELYLLPELAPIDKDSRLAWNPANEPTLELPGNGSLHAIPVSGEGLPGQCYEVRYRQGGENCRLARRPTKSLKKILQEAGVKPWLRDRLPLLFAGEDLAAIPGIGSTASASATPGYRMEWRDPYAHNDMAGKPVSD